jgi:hypothetical protein
MGIMKHSTSQLSPKYAQKIVDDFNRRVQIGDEVFYYPVLSNNHEPATSKRLRTKSQAWILGDHTPVVYLEDVGNVSVTHCFPVKDNVLFKDEQTTLFKTA